MNTDTKPPFTYTVTVTDPKERVFTLQDIIDAMKKGYMIGAETEDINDYADFSIREYFKFHFSIDITEKK